MCFSSQVVWLMHPISAVSPQSDADWATQETWKRRFLVYHVGLATFAALALLIVSQIMIHFVDWSMGLAIFWNGSVGLAAFSLFNTTIPLLFPYI